MGERKIRVRLKNNWERNLINLLVIMVFLGGLYLAAVNYQFGYLIKDITFSEVIISLALIGVIILFFSRINYIIYPADFLQIDRNGINIIRGKKEIGKYSWGDISEIYLYSLELSLYVTFVFKNGVKKEMKFGEMWAFTDFFDFDLALRYNFYKFMYNFGEIPELKGRLNYEFLEELIKSHKLPFPYEFNMNESSEK